MNTASLLALLDKPYSVQEKPSPSWFPLLSLKSVITHAPLAVLVLAIIAGLGLTPYLGDIVSVDQTDNFSIDVLIEYGNHPAYDADNDGEENLTGVIDFTFRSYFGWNATYDHISTQWDVHTQDHNRTVLCYGNEHLCQDINTQYITADWNESFALYYGRYGAAEVNKVRVKLWYKNSSAPNATILSTAWSELYANFTLAKPAPVISKNTSSPLEHTVCHIPNITLSYDQQFTLDLTEHCPLPNATYTASTPQDVSLTIHNNQLIAQSDEQFRGTRFGFITASVNKRSLVSNVFRIDVVDASMLPTPDYIEVGKPVVWRQRVISDTFEIPKNAYNLSVDELNKGTLKKIPKHTLRVIENSISKSLDDFTRSKRTVQTPRISGFAVAQANQPPLLLLNASNEHIVQFHMPAPTKRERMVNTSRTIKEIVVSSNETLEYTNVRVTTEIPPSTARYRLYHIINNKRVDITSKSSYKVQYNDTTGDGLFDIVSWTVPHLSDQYFELGLATINTNKSRYLVQEPVQLIAAVLNTRGGLVSSALVNISVQSPTGNITHFSTNLSTVIETEKGVYTSLYTQTSQIGNYSISVRAIGTDVNNSMESFFEVVTSLPYDIIRDSPAITDPFTTDFETRLTVVSYTNYTNVTLVETIPKSFTLTEVSNAQVHTTATIHVLTFTAQNNTPVAYRAKAPKITPSLWDLGPATVHTSNHTYAEAKSWYLAVDPLCAPFCATNVLAEQDRVQLTGISSTTDALTNTYNISHSFIRVLSSMNSDSDDEPEESYSTVEFSSVANDLSSEVTVTRQSATGNAHATYSIVGAENINVCNITHTMASGDENDDVSLANCWFPIPADYENKCYVESFHNYRTDTNQGNSCNSIHKVLKNITSTTNLNLRRDSSVGGCTTGNRETVQQLYVVCFNDDTNVTPVHLPLQDVQSGPTEIAIGHSVNRSRTYVTHSFLATDDGIEQHNLGAWLGSDSTVNFTRSPSQTTGGTVEALAYVIQFDSPTAFVESHQFPDATVGDQVSFSGDLDNVYNLSKTHLSCSWGYHSGEGTNHWKGSYSCYMSDQDTVFCGRGGTGNQNPSHDVMCQAIHWPSKMNFETGIDDKNIHLNASINNSAPKLNDGINLSGNVSDGVSLDSCEFSHNLSGNTITDSIALSGTSGFCSYNYTVNLTRGNVVNFTIRVVNSFSNGNATSFITTVANTPNENATLITTNNHVFFNQSTLEWLNATDADNDTLIHRVYISRFQSILPFNQSSESFTQNYTSVNLTDGVWYWRINATDTFSVSLSEVRNFTIDQTPPNITLISPINRTYIPNSSVNFTFNVSDHTNVDNCSLYFQGISIALDTNTSVNKNLTQQLNRSGLGDASYLWFVNCTDAFGQTGMSEVFNVTLDTIDPQVTLVYPENNTINSTGFVQSSFTASEEHLANCTLYHNNTGVWQANQTLGLISNGVQTSFNQTHYHDKQTDWNVLCTDRSGRTDWGGSLTSTDENFTILIDTQPPELFFEIPTPVNNSNISINQLFVNVSTNENNTATIQLYVNGTLNISKTYTRDNNHTNFTVNFIKDGEYYYSVQLNDTAGHTNETINRTVRIDTTPPRLSLVAPANDTWFTNLSNFIYFSYTPYDDVTTVQNCTLIINNEVNYTNSTILEGIANNFSEFLPQGYYNWSVNCSDDVHNTNQTEHRLIKIDQEFPLINDENVSNRSFDANELVCLNLTAYDNISGVSEVTVTVDYPLSGHTNVSLSNESGGCGNAGGGIWSYELLLEEQGEYVWNTTYTLDFAGNLNRSNPPSLINWTSFSNNQFTLALLEPLSPLKINESVPSNNYTQRCGVSCSLGTCEDTLLFLQYYNGSYTDITNTSDNLFANLRNVSCGTLSAGGSEWWNSSFAYRMQLTLNNSDRNENLSNFTVLVKLTTSRFSYANAQTDGDDLRFVDADGTTLLSYHFENWDPAGDSFVWVKVPDIASNSNTDFIWMYYGSDEASNVRNTSESYDSFTQFVSHFNGTAHDISQNYYQATTSGTPDQEVTPLGYGYNFNEAGSGEYFDYGDTQAIDGQPQLTLEAYIHTDSTDGDDMILAKRSTSTTPYLLFWRDETASGGSGRTNTFSFTAFAGSGTRYEASTNSMSDTDWHYLSVVFNGSEATAGERLRGYIDGYEDGVSPETTSSTVTPDITDPLTVGKWLFSDTYNFDGTITEIRLSTTARSTEWINATHHTFEDQFVGYGSEESFTYQCTGNFSVTAEHNTGYQLLPTRCVARSSTTPIAFSQEVNITINNRPFANFTYPEPFDYLSGIEVLNGSTSNDTDGNLTGFSFELDDNVDFSSSSLLCSSNLSNCTFDTTVQTQCSQETFNCYLRLNVTDNDGLSNSSTHRISIDNTGPTLELDQLANLTNTSENLLTLNATVVDLGSGVNVTTFLYKDQPEDDWSFACEDTDGQTPFSCVWDTTGLPTRSDYHIIAYANDSEGNRGNNDTHFNITLDYEPPEIQLIGPENNTYRRENVTFSYNVTDYQSEISSCFLVLNGSLNVSTFGVSENSTRTFSLTHIDDGIYNWSVQCNDTLSNVNTTAPRILNVDQSPPVIVLNTPTDFDNISTTSYQVNATVIDLGIGVNKTFFEFRSGEGIAWGPICVDTETQDDYYNCTWDTGALDEGISYQVRVFANDSFNQSSVFVNATNITLDRTAPNVTLLAPANNSLDVDGNITFSYNVTDNLLDIRNCSLILNGTINTTDTTITQEIEQVITTSTLENGFYNWTIGCYDTADNFFAPLSYNITVAPDTTGPSITLISPPNNSIYGERDVDFEFNVTDVSSDILSCSIIINNKINVSNTSVLSETAVNTITVNDLAPTDYNWSVNCTDSSPLQNNATTGTFNFTVQEIPGAISVVLIQPPEQQETQVFYNRTFLMRANITCNGEIGISCGRIDANARYNASSEERLGTGNEGNLRVTQANQIVNNYTAVQNDTVPVGSNVIRFNDTTKFSLGDEVMIHQTQDPPGTANSGFFEFLTITEINGDTVTFDEGTIHSYASSRFNRTNASATQAIRVPQYGVVNITTGSSITAQPWNGSAGGIVVFRATQEVVFVGTGEVTVDALGYRGGRCGDCGDSDWGQNGEGAIGIGTGGGPTQPGSWPEADFGSNGGAGGFGPSGAGGEPGGGGSYGTAGDASVTSNGNPADGGDIVGVANLTRLHFGGGGGGGGDHDSQAPDGIGGAGAGAVIIFAHHILNAQISADGEDGITDVGIGGETGGGAGGAIFLTAINISISSVSAIGGSGQVDGSDTSGDGGDGRVRLDYTNLFGSPNPGSGFTGEELSLLGFTPISTTPGALPFFSYSAQPQFCVLDQGESCEVNWTINATGDLGSQYLVDVNISSNISLVSSNKTRNATVNISSDSFDPSISLLTGNESWTLYDIVLEYIPYDDSPLLNCSLRLDSVLNETRDLIDENELNNFSLYNLEEGRYLWTVNCTDYELNTGTNTSVRTFFVDRTSPTVNLTTPTIGENVSSTTLELNFSVIDNLDTNLSCNVTIDSSVNTTTFAVNGTNTSVVISGFTQGTHTWSVACEDNATNGASSTTRSFFVDTIPPSIDLNTPENDTWSQTNLITFNFTANDARIDACELHANFTGVFTNVSRLTEPQTSIHDLFPNIDVRNGVFVWNVNCSDRSGNYNFSTHNYTINVDSQPPKIDYVFPTPANNTNFSFSSFTINISYDDNTSDSAAFYLNETVYDLRTISPSLNYSNATLTSIPDGEYFFHVQINDSANNRNNTINRTVRIDTTPPRLDLLLPANNSWRNNKTTLVTFRYTPYDDVTTVQNCTLSVGTLQNHTNTTIFEASVNTFFEPFTQADYNWSIACVDDVDNVNSSEERLLRVDQDFPYSSLESINQTEANVSESTCVNVSGFDDLSGVAGVTVGIVLPFSGFTNYTLDNETSSCGGVGGSSYSAAILSLETGVYNWTTVFVQDVAGNVNTTVLTTPLSWNVTGESELSVTFTTPTENFEINESGTNVNYSMRCDIECVSGVCNDVTVLAQYDNGTFEDITTTSSDLYNEVDNLSCGNLVAPGANWFNTAWESRIPITFNYSGHESLVNFTALIRLTPSNFDYSGAQTDGGDIRFVDDDDTTEIPYHFERWTYNGESLIWVKVPRIEADTTSDFIYLYYNNSIASSAENESQTYDNNYTAVYHMHTENTQVNDSTRHGLDMPEFASPTYEVAGQIGFAAELDGGGSQSAGDADSFEITGQGPLATSHTVEAWINPDTTADKSGFGRAFWSYSTPSNGHYSSWYTVSANEIEVESYETDTTNFFTTSTSGSITTGNWHHIAITSIRGAETTIFINGENVSDYINDGDNGDNFGWTLGDLRADRAINFDGRLDEVRFSNGSLRSPNWINASYQSQRDRLAVFGNSQANNFDDRCNVSFVISAGVNSGNNDYPTRCFATSITSSVAFSSEINVTINDFPVSNVTYPEPFDWLARTEILNASYSRDLDGYLYKYTFEFDNTPAFDSPDLLCESNLSNCTADFTGQTQCAEETFGCYLRVNVTDNDGTSNFSVVRIGIDSTGPTTRITLPTNRTNSSGTSLKLNATATDVGSGLNTTSFFYRQDPTQNYQLACIDDDGVTPVECFWDTSSVADGNFYEILVYSNDTKGNIGNNESSVNITLDRQGPFITLVQPGNNTFAPTNISFRYSPGDYHSDIESCSLIIDNNVNVTVNDPAINVTLEQNVSGFNSGTYAWNVSCVDHLGNEGASLVQFFTVDITAPTISLNSPITLENISTSTFRVNATVNDPESAINATHFEYRKNDTESWSTICVTEEVSSSFANCTWDLTTLEEGTQYQVRVSTNNTVGLRSNYVNATNITIDLNAPEILLITPINGTQDPDGNITFVYNASDALLGVLNCSLYINSTFNTSTQTVSETSENTFTTSTFNDGTYNWSVQCFDTAENGRFSSTNTFFVAPDLDPPIVQLVSPTNNTVYGSRDVTFTFNVSDFASDIYNCSLIINNQINLTNITLIEEDEPQSLVVNDVADGNYNWSVNCSDSSVLRNMGSSGTHNLTVIESSARIGVTLINPDPALPVNDVYYNRTFVVHSSVACIGTEGAVCGNVSATVRYNVTTTASDFGFGEEGTRTITGGSTIVNNYTALTNQTAGVGSTLLSVQDATEFSIGDEVMIIQVQDNATSNKSGNFEFVTINGKNANNLELASGLNRNYTSGLANQVNASTTQLVRVPRFKQLTINNGASITAPTWNGQTGGIVVLKVQNNVTFVGSGSITVSQLGFRGGAVGLANNAPGTGGEGHLGLGELGSTAAGPFYVYNNNSGGTGGRGASDCGGGGGGGGHAFSGTEGNNRISTPGDESYGGSATGNGSIFRMYFGGGGGGGGDHDNSGLDADGGDGGGIVYITAQSITNAQITSNGESKTDEGGCGPAEGSGGAGGSIYLRAFNITINSVTASGGTGADIPDDNEGYGGNGSVGRIRLDYLGLAGASSPAAGYEGSPPGVFNISEMVMINSSIGGHPLFSYSAQPQYCVLDDGDTCEMNWTINATGPLGSFYTININATSNNSEVITNVSLNATINITLDQLNPSISLITNNETWTQENITLQYIPYDGSPILNCSLILDGEVTTRYDINVTRYNNFTLENLSQGAYTWTVNCSDYEGNQGTNTSVRTFYVDHDAPVVNLTTPFEGINTSIAEILFNFTVTDHFDQNLTCNLSINSLVNVSLINTPNSTPTNVSVSGFNDGSYDWNVRCIDNATNKNTSVTRNFVIDTIPPKINLSTPKNNTWVNIRPSNYTYIPNDTNEVRACELWANFTGVWQRNRTSDRPTLLAINNISSFAPDGTFVWNINCSDYADNSNFSSHNYTVNIDTVVPKINFTLETELNGTVRSQRHIFINVTANDSQFANLTFFLYNGTFNLINETTYTVIDFMSNMSINFTNLPENAEYHYVVTITDKAFNQNSTEQRTIIFDNIFPQIDFSADTLANNTIINQNYVYINTTVVEENIANLTFFLYNSSFDLINISIHPQLFVNFTDLVDTNELYYYNVTVRDRAGLENHTETRIIILDTLSSNITYEQPTPTNNTNLSTTSFVVNVSFIDANPNAVTLYLNASIIQTRFVQDNFTNFTLLGIADGEYTYYVEANDSASNTNSTENRTIRIDTTPPRLDLVQPINNTWRNNNTMDVFFTYTAYDDVTTVQNCSLFVNGEHNFTNHTVVEGGLSNFSSMFTEGFYNWSINCSDDLNNVNVSATRLVKVDQGFPTILNQSANETFKNVSSYVCLNATVADTLSGINETYAQIREPDNVVLNYFLFDNHTTTCDPVAGDGVYSAEIRLTKVGQYNWTYTFTNDTAGNTNFSFTNIVFNSTSPAQLEVNMTIPLVNFEINESDDTTNYTFTTECVAICLSNNGVQNCTDVTLTPQYNLSGIPTDITTVTPFLYSSNTTFDCGNLTEGDPTSRCATNFTIVTTPDAGGTEWELTCRTNSDVAGSYTSLESVNISVNDHPTAQFSYPTVFTWLTGFEVINGSASSDSDGNVSYYRFELDSTLAFESPTLICQSNLSNCTLNTVTQTQCTEESTSCFIKLNVTDDDGLFNTTIQQVGIDNTGPLASLTFPTNLSNISGTSVELTASITDGGSGVNQSTFYFRESPGDPWQVACIDSDPASGYNCTWDIDTLDDNTTYELRVSANDTNGNQGDNHTTQNVTLDRGFPSITLIDPANNTRFLNGNVTFSFIVNDTTSLIQNCSLLFNTELNESLHRPSIGLNNFSLVSIPEDTYNWSVQCYDTAGNLNTSEQRNISIQSDNEPPIVTLISPLNESTTTAEVITFQYNVTDYYSTIKNCSLYVNDQFNQTSQNVVRNATQSFILTDLPNGDYTWFVTCHDNGTNFNEGVSDYFAFSLFKAELLTVNVSSHTVQHDQGVQVPANITVEDALGGRVESNITSDVIYHNQTNITIPWWNESFTYRQLINITNDVDFSLNFSKALPANYTINFTFDTTGLVSDGVMQADGDDLRVAYFNNETNTWQELDREITSMNTAATTVLFKTGQSVPVNESSVYHYLFYGNDSVSAGPSQKAGIFFYYDDFSVNSTLRYNRTKDFEDLSEADDTTVFYDDTNEWMSYTAESSAGKTLRRNYTSSDMIIEGYYFYQSRTGVSNRLEIGGHIDGDSYYYFYTSSNIEGTELARMNDGAKTSLATDGTTYPTTGEWYHLRLSILTNSSSTMLTGAVNGDVILSHNDSSPNRLTTGGFGVGQYQTNGQWDNISVRLTRLIEPSLALQDVEEHKFRDHRPSGLDGEIYINFTTDDFLLGNYSIVSRAVSAGYVAGVGAFTVELVSPQTPPTILLIDPVNDYNSTEGELVFNWTAIASVANNLTCNVSIDGVVLANKSVVSSQDTNTTIGNISEGGHTWAVNCTDYFGNSGASISSNFSVIAGPDALNATLATDNTSVYLDWSDKNYTVTYHLFMTDNFTQGFSSIPNITINGTNYTDSTSNETTTRFYKIATVKGNVNKSSTILVAKYDIALVNTTQGTPDFNLISLPLNLTNYELHNGSNDGYDLPVSEQGCLVSLWSYNNSRNTFDRLDHNGTSWIPAAGSEQFTHLAPGRGYWVEANKSCTYTVIGTVPEANVSIGLDQGWNIVGWHSVNQSRLPQNFAPTRPIDVNPAGSVRTINRYDVYDEAFEVTVHYAVGATDWGWFPSFNNQDFVTMDPALGYYFDTTTPSTWEYKPTTGLNEDE